jgi:hypothetical protein
MVARADDGGIIQRMLAAQAGKLPLEAARFFLGLSFSASDRRRIKALSRKANEGELTSAEHDELATYVLLGDFLVIMQSRARASMRKTSPAA